jgi:hypothetical protein
LVGWEIKRHGLASRSEKVSKMAGARALKNGRAGGIGRGVLHATVLSGEVREINTRANITYGGDGGAIGNIGETGLDLTDVAISDNHARAYGAGIYNESYFDAVGTQITGNDAVSGGGIYDVEDEDFTTPTLTSSSVVDNKPDNCEPLGSIPGCTG